MIKKKTNNVEVLPTKGETLANELKIYILDKNDIPFELQKAFSEITKTC
jgi:hypothetical protein